MSCRSSPVATVHIGTNRFLVASFRPDTDVAQEAVEDGCLLRLLDRHRSDGERKLGGRARAELDDLLDSDVLAVEPQRQGRAIEDRRDVMPATLVARETALHGDLDPLLVAHAEREATRGAEAEVERTRDPRLSRRDSSERSRAPVSFSAVRILKRNAIVIGSEAPGIRGP